MDPVLEDLLRAFQAEHGLTGLTREQAFETFTTFCILGLHYDESDDTFAPDTARVGGPGDLGIDAVVVEINDRICTTVEDVRKVVEKALRVRAKFIVVQAKARSRFESDVITKLGEALYQVFRQEPMTFNASKRIQDLRACVEVVYADTRKFRERPALSVYYAVGGPKPIGELAGRRAEASARLDALNRLQPVKFRLVGTDELVELYRRTSDAVSASIVMENRVILPSIPGVRQAYIGALGCGRQPSN